MSSSQADTAIAAVRAAFEDKKPEALENMLAEGIELRPPTYGKSWHGRALVAPLLGFAAQSFDSLRYTDIVTQGAISILRFEAEVAGHVLSGVDLVRLDDDGQVLLFEIFSRPPKVALLLLDRMTAKVQQSPEIAVAMRVAGGANQQ